MTTSCRDDDLESEHGDANERLGDLEKEVAQLRADRAAAIVNIERLEKRARRAVYALWD